MRKGIDHIGVGVGAIIQRDDGRIFLAKRGRDARNERHRWEFPGGSVEFGETLKNAVVREINEEYGFDIIVLRLLDVVDHILPEEHQHWVSPTYLCSYSGGTPKIKELNKCEEIGWFELDRIPYIDLSQASKKSLESYRSFLGLS